MKSYIITMFLSILLLIGCAPAETTTPIVNPSNLTETDTPVPEKTITPTATDSSVLKFTEDYMVLQQGNDAPAFLLVTAPSQELGDNNIGLWYETYDRYYDSEFVYRNGFKHMRIGALFGKEVQKEWPIREDTLMAEVDDIITEYAENGVTIVLATQNGSGLPFVITEFKTQEEIDIFLEYITFLSTQFKGRIEYYEIWNEYGNVGTVPYYTAIVEKSVEVIKEIDPDAKVIMGGVPGDWLEGEPGYGEHERFIVSSEFMEKMIRLTNFEEVAVDGISWHPLYGNIPEDPYYQAYPELVREFQAMAESRGFTGEYFADEILWHTVNEPGFTHGPPVSKLIAAKYYTRTIAEHRGLGVNVTINTFFQVPELTAIKNINNVMVGAEPTDVIAVSLESSEAVEYLRQYTFTLPNGDILLAVWTNGPAVEEDFGVNFTLTINEFSADGVAGIDIFHGFEQELVYETVDSDLVIRDLLVKDYPIFIKLIGGAP